MNINFISIYNLYMFIIKIIFFIINCFLLYNILNKITRNFVIIITFKKEFFVFLFSIFLPFYIYNYYLFFFE